MEREIETEQDDELLSNVTDETVESVESTESTESVESTETVEQQTTETEAQPTEQQTTDATDNVDNNIVDFEAAQHQKFVESARQKLAQYFNGDAQPQQTQQHSPSEAQAPAPMQQPDTAPTPTFSRPDPKQDIIGWMEYVDSVVQQNQQLQQQWAQQQAQQQQQQEILQQIDVFYRSSMKAAERSKPDINTAVDYLYDLRANEMRKLAHLYPDFNNDSVIDRRIGEEYRDIVIACAQRGLDPAEELYKMALARGYKQTTQAPKQSLSELQRKQASAKSLTSSGGTRGDDAMSLEWIDSLSEEELMDIALNDQKRYKQIEKVLAGA